uniref:CHK domain-containing protein n=1 Tax=Anisakis simplex TaxID=6269 RepID=A0A0M3J7V0_ANISI
LDAVSEVHAYSIKHPECFKSIHPNKFIDNLVQAHDERSSPLVLLKDLKVRYKEKLGNTIDEIIKNIDEIFNKNTINELNAKFGMQPTLAHCELWTQNLIWKEHDKKRELAAIIDWECVHEGNPSEDIAFMIASSLSADDRHQHADTILKHYYDHLTELLQQQPPFTLQQV